MKELSPRLQGGVCNCLSVHRSCTFGMRVSEHIVGPPEEEILAESYQCSTPPVWSGPDLPVISCMPKAVPLDQLAPMGVESALQAWSALSILMPKLYESCTTVFTAS